jgi:hypothetical protein
MNINRRIKLAIAMLSLIITPSLAGQAFGQVLLIDHQNRVTDLSRNRGNNVATERGRVKENLHAKILNSSPLPVPPG